MIYPDLKRNSCNLEGKLRSQKRRHTRSGIEKAGTRRIPTRRQRLNTRSGGLRNLKEKQGAPIPLKKASLGPKNKRGRKLKLHPDWPLLAEGHARDGMIDAEIAKKLGIAKSTFYEYMKKFPDFSEAIARGKLPVDFEAESLLLKRCRGFEYVETTIEFLPSPIKKDGKLKEEKVAKVKKVTKTVIPDTRALEIWVQNRMPEKWLKRYDKNAASSEPTEITIITKVPRPGDKIKKQ